MKVFIPTIERAEVVFLDPAQHTFQDVDATLKANPMVFGMREVNGKA